jgi:hypothetical protein
MPAKGSRSQRFGWSRQARCLRKCGWPSYPFGIAVANSPHKQARLWITRHHGWSAVASLLPAGSRVEGQSALERVVSRGMTRLAPLDQQRPYMSLKMSQCSGTISLHRRINRQFFREASRCRRQNQATRKQAHAKKKIGMPFHTCILVPAAKLQKNKKMGPAKRLVF